MNEHLQYVRDVITAVLPPHATVAIENHRVTVTCSANVFDAARATYAIMQVELSDEPTFTLDNDTFTVSATLD